MFSCFICDEHPLLDEHQFKINAARSSPSSLLSRGLCFCSLLLFLLLVLALALLGLFVLALCVAQITSLFCLCFGADLLEFFNFFLRLARKLTALKIAPLVLLKHPHKTTTRSSMQLTNVKITPIAQVAPTSSLSAGGVLRVGKPGALLRLATARLKHTTKACEIEFCFFFLSLSLCSPVLSFFRCCATAAHICE